MMLFWSAVFVKKIRTYCGLHDTCFLLWLGNVERIPAIMKLQHISKAFLVRNLENVESREKTRKTRKRRKK